MNNMQLFYNMFKNKNESEVANQLSIDPNKIMVKEFVNKSKQNIDTNIEETNPINKNEIETQEKSMEKDKVISKLQDGFNSFIQNLFNSETTPKAGAEEEKVEEIVEETEEVKEEAEEEVEETKTESETEEAPVEEEKVEETEEVAPKAEETTKEEITEPENSKKIVENVLEEVKPEMKKSKLEKEVENLQKQILELQKEKEEQAEKAEKENVLSLVKKELAFVVGTIEENADKLFELKKAVSEDQYAWIVKNLKKQSEHVEKALEESGVESPEAEDMTAHQKLEKIAKGYQEVEKELTFEQAYRKAQDFNPDLASLAIKGE